MRGSRISLAVSPRERSKWPAPARGAGRLLQPINRTLSGKPRGRDMNGRHSTVNHLAYARSKVGAETTSRLVWILAARLPEPSPADPAVEVSTRP
jgi:hypothetical protein